VYGGNKAMPFAEGQPVNHQVSLCAATKKANELMAHTYSHLYGLPATGLRLFTVYGPWGRPEMAPMLFAKAILAEWPLSGAIGIGAVDLDGLHADPADRWIVATALDLGAELLTADERLLAWKGPLCCVDARR